jgi:hypothetical protein
MRGWLPGVILIAVGVTLFAVQLLHLDGDVIVLVIGLVFAVAFAGSRRYGLLIPAGILTGLGLGIVLEDARVQGEPVVLGLGLGFLAIYAESTLGPEGARLIELGWPIVLVAAGAWLLLRGRIAT